MHASSALSLIRLLIYQYLKKSPRETSKPGKEARVFQRNAGLCEREAVEHAVHVLGFSERKACRVIGQLRSTQRYIPKPNPFKKKLRERVISLATEYGRYGYRTITSMLNMEGWHVGKDRVYNIWREEGLKVPQK